MEQQLVIAGFGGQGVMSLGQMLAYGGMMEGRNVSWLPSYGPEMRGGSAYCHVIISDDPVGSPIITQASCLMALNLPSLDSFENMIVPGGLLIVNSSLISRKAARADVKTLYVPANDIATELNNPRVAGMVMLGAFIHASGAVSADSVLEALKKVLGERKLDMIPVNKAALERGAALVE